MINFDLNNFGNNFEEKFYLASRESSLNDPLYRYQIAKPVIVVTGKKGNRVTWFENSETFAKSVQRPSEYFIKYISNKLSCPSKFDKDKNCQYLKGEYTYDLVVSHLKDFIKIYILCDECDYPDTKLVMNEKKIVEIHCESCGHNSFVPSKYMDKTYDFIEKKLK